MTTRINRPHRKPGPPPKRLPATLEQLQTLAGLGLTEEEIALYLGICRTTLHKRKKKNKALGEAIRAGKVKADATVIKSLYTRATTDNDTTAMIFWLKNRQPDRWKDRHEIAGSVGLTGRLSFVDMKKSLKGIDSESRTVVK